MSSKASPIRAITFQFGQKNFILNCNSSTSLEAVRAHVASEFLLVDFFLLVHKGIKDNDIIVKSKNDWNNFLFTARDPYLIQVYSKRNVPENLRVIFSREKSEYLFNNIPSKTQNKIHSTDEIIRNIQVQLSSLVTGFNTNSLKLPIENSCSDINDSWDNLFQESAAIQKVSSISTFDLSRENHSRNSYRTNLSETSGKLEHNTNGLVPNNLEAPTCLEKTKVISKLVYHFSDCISTNPVATLTEILLDQILDGDNINLQVLQKTFQRLTVMKDYSTF